MVTLEFHSTERSGLDSKLRVYSNTENELYIIIEIDEMCWGNICMDKETAIKFSKEVRKQISFLED